jgi:hypothetical protein
LRQWLTKSLCCKIWYVTSVADAFFNLPSMFAEDQGGTVATGCFTHRPSEQRLNFSITTVGAW